MRGLQHPMQFKREGRRKKMKRILSICVLLALLMSSCVIAQASSVSTTATGPLDIILVIDQSHSMSQSGIKADTDNYRMEAANMVTAMAEGTHGSRVAVLSFNYDVEIVSDFVDVSDPVKRQGVIDAIKRRVNNTTTDGSTDYGEALYKAYQMHENSGSTNEAMIILLTDGKNSYTRENLKPYWEFNGTDIVPMKLKSIRPTEEQMNSLALAVAQLSAIKGYTIYTIGLGSDIDAEAAALLKDIAAITGGKYRHTSYGSDLPAFFADMFSTRIGSSLLSVNIDWDAARKEYVVSIPVLNSYADEANLYLETATRRAGGNGTVEKIDKSSIRLVSPSGTTYTAADMKRDVQVLESEKFTLIKLADPTTGVWRLTFKGVGDYADGSLQSSSSGVKFTLLFNYDIDLDFVSGTAYQRKDGTPYTPAVDPDGTVILSKTDRISLTPRFVDRLTKSPVDDELLYRNVAFYRATDPFADLINSGNYDWFPIELYCSLYSVGADGSYHDLGKAIQLTSDTNRQLFEGDVDLAQFYTISGFNAFKSGQKYALRITAKGAGFDRTYDLPFRFLNKTLDDLDMEVLYEVEDPSRPQLDGKARNFSIQLPDRDLDGENISYSGLTLVSADPAGCFDLSLTPDSNILTGRLTETAGKFDLRPDGTAEAVYSITGVDSADGSSFTYTVTLKAVSITKKPRSYNLTVIYTDANGAQQTAHQNTGLNISVPKGSEIILKMEAAKPEDMPHSAMKYTVMEGTTPIVPETTVAETATIKVGENRATREIQITFHYGSGATQAEMGTANLTYTVIENAPEADETAWKEDVISLTEAANADGSLNKVIRFNPLPVVNTIVDKPNTEIRTLESGEEAECIVIDLKPLFSDPDKADSLAYKHLLAPTKNTDRAFSVVPNEDGSVLTITYLKKGGTSHGVLEIAAADKDGMEATVTLNITVVDLTAKWLYLISLALAALVALIVLVLAIRQAAKPRYFRDARLAVHEGVSLSASQTTELRGNKKTMTLRPFVDAELAKIAGISPDILDRIIIRPSTRSSIQVRLKKPLLGTSAEVDGHSLHKKWLEWHKDHDLILTGSQSDGLVIKLQDNEGDVIAIPMTGTGFGDGDGFGGTPFENGGFGGGSSKKNDDFGDF